MEIIKPQAIFIIFLVSSFSFIGLSTVAMSGGKAYESELGTPTPLVDFLETPPPQLEPTPPPAPTLDQQEKKETDNLKFAQQLNLTSSPPSNDDFDNAVLVTLSPYQQTLDTTGATVATDDPDSSVYDYSDSYSSVKDWHQLYFGGRLALDGNDDYAETEDESELDVGDEVGESFTIEAWVLILSSSSSSFDLQYIVKKPDSYRLYAVRYYDFGSGHYVGCIGFILTAPSGQLRGFEHCRWPAYSLGWHHVALVFYQEIGEARIFKDGEAFGNPGSVGSVMNNSTEGVKIGENLAGGLDEVRISDVARYTNSTYITPTLPFTCDEYTRALWHFDEFEGMTIFHDACGVDNVLIGYNGTHTVGVPAHRIYLPLIIK